MNRFTAAEIAYLQSQRLGRLATVNAKGDLHVVPVSFRYNADQVRPSVTCLHCEPTLLIPLK
jgi:pyridoxamine 5'-phosphate oxidase family protein